MEEYAENLLNDKYEDDAYEFAHEVLGPMTKWVIVDYDENYVFSEMTVNFPKNPYFEGCDEDHTFVLNITIHRDDNATIKEVTKVIIDGEDCNLGDIDLDNLIDFATDRKQDGWDPYISKDGRKMDTIRPIE